MATHKDLSPRELRLTQGIASGKTKQQAAIDAGYGTTPGSAAAQATEVLKRPHVKAALYEALSQHGIDLDSAIAPIGKGLRALKQNEYTGEITEDLQTQLKASDRALKLLGVTNDRDEGGTTNYNFINVVNEQRERYTKKGDKQ